jgi:dephospho-CoA kinase
MLKIGLTGGIGSGKTTVAKIFEILAVPVYYADSAARQLMQEDAALIDAIKNAFGENAYRNGQLDRAYLADKVFSQPHQLQILNALVHPAVIAAADKWFARHNAPYVVKEAALIFESGSQEGLDKVIGVFAPQALRISRVMKRDGISRDAVLARMDKQIDEQLKMKLCDYVITNDNQHLLIPQVLKISEELLQLQKTSL